MATKKKASKTGSKGKGSSKVPKGKGKAKSKAMSTKRFRGNTALVGTPITAGGDG